MYNVITLGQKLNYIYKFEFESIFFIIIHFYYFKIKAPVLFKIIFVHYIRN